MTKKYILVIFLFLTARTHAANIVFDLGEVLIETKYAQTLWNIGPFKFVHYASTGNNPFSAHKKLFTFLDGIKPYNESQIIIKDAHGHRMPQLMIDWLKGIASGQEILHLTHKTPGNFTNQAEENLVRALAEVLFTPAYFVQTRQLINQGVNLVKDCKKAGHSVFLLSNWEPESMELLEQLYPEFFGLFDGAVISGRVGLVKPDPAIYEYLLKTYDLEPEQTIFIDDQPENIAAAQALGIHGIVYQKKRGFLGSYHDFETVRRTIDSHLTSKNLLIPINHHR